MNKIIEMKKEKMKKIKNTKYETKKSYAHMLLSLITVIQFEDCENVSNAYRLFFELQYHFQRHQPISNNILVPIILRLHPTILRS